MAPKKPILSLSLSSKAKGRRKFRFRSSTRRTVYPVVDLFAGPGGLGEGFASTVDQYGHRRFSSAVSVERDKCSHTTLLTRHFFRHFEEGEVPDAYYDFLAKRITRDELFSRFPDAYADAKASALQISLGPESHAQVRRAIRERLGRNKLWALVGGPPCQVYSRVGRSRMKSQPGFKKDERHTLYLEYLRIIADHRPPVFVMENVAGLLSATIDGKSAISRIVNDLSNPRVAIRSAPRDLAYKLYSLAEEESGEGEVDPRLFVVRAEQYGIPQARHRMFIVGVRADLKVRPKLLKKLRAPTVRDAIGSLPAIRSALSREDCFESWQREIHSIAGMSLRRQLNGASYAQALADGLTIEKLAYLDAPRQSSSEQYVLPKARHEILRRLGDDRLTVLTSHDSRSHMASDLRRYIFAASFAQETGRSPRLANFPTSLLPDHENVELGRNGKMFADRFRVQLPDQVATTITSHIAKDGHYFIHYDPSQCRSLTVREAARLQTFPDNYYFAGPRTAQYRQVGNAVPPQLARQIAEVVAEVLESIPGNLK